MANFKILVVDDDEGILELVGLILRREGYEVLLARNGAEALQLVRDGQPDLMILDVMMPILDGYQVAAEIQRDKALSKRPKIVLATSRDIQREGKIIEFTGACGALQKPFTPTALLEVVREILRGC